MSASLVGTITKNGAATTPTGTFVRDSGTAIGDTVLAIIIYRNVAATATAPDGTWSLFTDQQIGTAGTLGHIQVWSKTAATAGAKSEVFTYVKVADGTATSPTVTGFCAVMHGATGFALLGSANANNVAAASTAPVTTGEASEMILRILGGVINANAVETPITWDAACTKQLDGQGSANASTVWAFGSVATETGPNPAGSVAARSVTMPATPVGSGTVSLGFTTTSAAPVNTAAPAITTDGTPNTGETVTASTGTWSNSPTSYTYQWQRNGSNISGATASSYVLQSADEGTTVTVIVTATNGTGSASATSAGISPTAPAPVAPPVNTVAPSITGTLQAGQTVTVNIGAWSPAGDTYAYQWKRNGTAVSGATSSTYALTSPDVGTAILSCTVTATNGGGSVSANTPNADVAQATGDYVLDWYVVR